MTGFQKSKDLIFEQVARAAQQANHSRESVNIAAVMKYTDNGITARLINTGVEHIGENRVDIFLDKHEVSKDRNLTWYSVGSLQRRKIKNVINFADYLHILDFVELTSEIQKCAEHTIKCFLQANISEEESKHGSKAPKIDEALVAISEFDKVKIMGLMTMIPKEAFENEIEETFGKANQLRQELQTRQLPHMPFTELDMGMSSDYKIAIRDRVTFVRIGTSSFE